MHEEAGFFQELFFKDFSLSFLNLNLELELRKANFFKREQMFIAGHLRDKKVILKASNLDVRRTKSQNRNLQLA